MKKINKGIYASILLVLIIGISFYMFSSYIDNIANAAFESRLIETAKNNSLIVNSIIEGDEKQLKGTAERIANASDVNNIEKTQTILKGSMQFDSFTHLLVFTKNHLIYNENEIVTDSINVVLSEVVQDRIQAIKTPQSANGFAINVPIEKEGIQYGVLSGVYYNDQINELFDYSIFEGKGYFGILDQEGNVLLGSKKFQEIYKKKSIFDTLNDANFHSSHSLSEMKLELSNRNSFFTSYTIKDVGRYAYLMPLGIADWYIMSAVPAAYLTTYKAGIDTAIFIFILFISILFLVLVIIILQQSRRSQKALRSDRDAMERIINTVPMPILITDQNRNIVQLNQIAIEAFENHGEKIIGKPCSCMHMDICGSKLCSIERFIQECITTTTATYEDTKYFVTTTQMKDSHGEWIGFIETFQNISEIMKNKQVLEERTLELETISENLSAGLLITSLEEGFTILQCNKTYLDLIEDEEENVIGKPAIQWLLKNNASEVENNIFEQLHEKGSVYLEHLLKRSEGNEIWVSLSGKQGILHKQKVGIWVLVDISERKLADKSIRINEERYRVAVENTEDIIVDYDIVNDEMLHNDKVLELYNVDVLVKHPLDKIIESGIIAKDYISVFQSIFEKIQQGSPKVIDDLKTVSKNGEEIWLHVIFTIIFDDHDIAVRAIGVMHDFTAEKKAVMKYEREVQYRKVTMEDAALCYEVDLNDLRFINGHETLVHKYATSSTVDYVTVVDLMLDYLVYEKDRDIVYRNTRPNFLQQCFATNQNKIEFEYRRILGRNEISWVRCTIHLYEEDVSKHLHVIGYIKDIDKAKKLEFHLKHQAERDLLTGLYNKITTQIKIDKCMDQLRDHMGALAIIDLDDFKNINDSFGHAFGDAVLSEVSQRLIKLSHEKELVGRIGGDEFIMYFPMLVSMEDVQERAKSICVMFRDAYTGRNNNYKISGSVGVAIAPRDGNNFEDLYRKADIALYSAKNSGKDMFCLFDTNLPPIGSEHMARRIDDNAGKQLSDNLAEYVLRILYEAKDPKLLLNAVLELVARQYKFSRGYVYVRAEERDYWTNTSEWCAEGIPTQKENMHHVKFGDYGLFEQHFNEFGEFMRYDMSDLNAQIADRIQSLHVQSFIQIALKREDEIMGFIGFDNCWKQWKPSREDLETFHIIAMLVDAFIFR